eukprot:scaffold3504_cov240-Pinguiococcus_pyrenoidosus.AAC.23
MSAAGATKSYTTPRESETPRKRALASRGSDTGEEFVAPPDSVAARRSALTLFCRSEKVLILTLDLSHLEVGRTQQLRASKTPETPAMLKCVHSTPTLNSQLRSADQNSAGS